ncbi:hypothetical protein HYFRA_00000690 [Hymenoscyphus fraxineus]|uniref:Uncharacterized protein n=1 Tax=Hymenoscyphus fraxineus TaxID=746836 RepID=A0A9N9L580_9HELO|nr:hypothetical protein HYFRA_00000690 [Hymenoscyphus fraxineus]
MSSHESPMTPVNCTNYPEGLEVDSDVSGIGVLCGFFVTACLVFVFSIIKTALDHLISSYEEPSPKLTRWSLAFRNTIIGFADQQVVTGISVIIAGAFQIQKGFSAYHWEVVVNLAWFSSVTHLITLTALRDDIHNHRIENNTTRLRIIGMSTLMIILIVSMYPMGFILVYDFSDYYLPRSIPIWCLYQPKLEWKYINRDPDFLIHKAAMQLSHVHTYNWTYIVIAYIALLYGFITRLIFLSKGKWNFQLPHLLTHRLNPIRMFENRMEKLKSLKHGGKHSIHRVVEYKILRTNYAIAVSSIDLYQSTLWETTWIFAALAWGTIRVFSTRDGIEDNPSYGHEEGIKAQQDDWTFGQMVPVVLLVLPILTLFG